MPPWSGPEDTGTHARPSQPLWGNPTDSGTHDRPWDTGTHSRPAQETDPYGWQASPYDTGNHTRPAPREVPPWSGPTGGGTPSAPSHVQGGYGTPGGPSPQDNTTHLPHPGPTGPHQPGPGHNPGQYGAGELLDGGYAPPAPPQYGGPASYEGRGGPAPSETTDLYPRDAYGRPLPPEGYYEGNYDDGRYR